jgi:hypothetical protein
MHPLKRLFNIVMYIFAAIGFVLMAVYAALQLGLTKTTGIIDTQRDHFKEQLVSGTTTETWNTGEEWDVLKEGITRDAEEITKAATTTGVSPRLIASLLVVEQLRLYHSDRELFKTAFAPLKVLAIQSQFSWGVMGIKRDTAIQIEENLASSTSPWYLGAEYENILLYSVDTEDINSERFNRLTNEEDRYYSYLYAGLFLRQIQVQWENAGFSIIDRPEILATLYDLGFEKSNPHANPLSGGAEIEIAGTSYSFGALAKKFYDSDELLDIFPR